MDDSFEESLWDDETSVKLSMGVLRRRAFFGLIKVEIWLIAVANLLLWLSYLGEMEGGNKVYTCAVRFVGRLVGIWYTILRNKGVLRRECGCKLWIIGDVYFLE